MKIDRVNQTGGMSDRDSNPARDFRSHNSFLIAASLESDGNSDAEDEEREAPNPSMSRSDAADGVSYPVVASVDFIENEVASSTDVPKDDSLDEFISRVRNARRLNLRF